MRSAGMTKIVRRLNVDRSSHLIDVILEQPGANEGPGADLVRKACRDPDPSFPTAGNDAEIRVLAEIALAIAMDREKENQLAGQVAILLFCALANGAREFSSVTDLPNRARDIVQRQGKLLRRRPRLPGKPRSYFGPLDLAGCLDGLVNIGDLNDARELMSRVSTKVNASLGQVADRARAEREALEEHIKLQDEEIDLLWWAANGQSETLRASFADLEPETRTLVAAAEAAHRTRVAPGPCSILGLLEKVGVRSDLELSIQDVVDSFDADSRQSIRVPDATVRTPLHLAMSMKEESQDSGTWSAHWSARTKVDVAKKRREVEIAELFYQERLALGVFGDGA